MGGSSNSTDNSFIPKRGSVKRNRRGASKQVYLFTVVSYVLFFATLVASAGVFLYGRYIDQQLNNEIAALNQEINQFREADLRQVQSFNNRLESTKERIAAAASLGTFFAALETATAETVQLTSLTMEREEDLSYTTIAAVETDSFDSSIFQREFYEQDRIINSVSIEELSVSSAGESEGVSAGESVIEFKLTLGVPIAGISYNPTQPVVRTDVVSQPPATTTPVTEAVDEDLSVSNQDSL